jgi:polyhydroxybutyrate depolymerase
VIRANAPRRALVAAVLVAVVAVAACSSSSDKSSSGTALQGSTTDTSTSSATTSPKPVPAKPSPGCSKTDAQPAVLYAPQKIEVDGTARDYLLTTPEAAPDKPLPLVLDFHGLAEGSIIHSKESEFGELGQKDGFVVVSPNGLGQPVMWDTAPDPATNKDLQYVQQVVHEVVTNHCIDETRVYSTGLSMGAFMTSTLACTMSANLAAIGPVAGLQYPEPCDQTRKVPILTYHGTADPILYFNGGIGLGKLKGVLPGADDPNAPSPTSAPLDLNGAGYPETVRKWAAKYGCQPKPSETKESEHITLRSYDCPPGVAVEFAIVQGGGHSWPGSTFDKSIEEIVGPTNYEVNATQQIWDFFTRFQVADPPAL